MSHGKKMYIRQAFQRYMRMIYDIALTICVAAQTRVCERLVKIIGAISPSKIVTNCPRVKRPLHNSNKIAI